MGCFHRYAKQLGDDVIQTLEHFYNLKMRSNPYRRTTAKYASGSVDATTSDYQHMSERERENYDEFYRIWRCLGRDFQQLASVLIFEETINDSVPGVLDVGILLTGSNDERRAIGGTVAALRILSWRLAELIRN